MEMAPAGAPPGSSSRLQFHRKRARPALARRARPALRTSHAVLLLRPASHRDQVDAVAVALAVGQVVTKVGAVQAHRLAVGEHPHVIPDRLLVAERRPSMRLGLG
eukprot:CAMPEP_0205908434 /NCGR_PEP_ID=MMETSP1325-20131115/3214_1 /ASSEMBLY_ACC=CAM_ASM_000708 /TAXON_ID=236786 /ORGANISM="Florenciella sp., Strain RCC1007" /LENGTH=104 /DNA_ID=CAMNT_0053274635 /DNA_START=252 /DNA_END=564 /DNA_ORIENTATION=-